MAVSDPDKLTYDELMYAATLTHNYASKLQIYTAATERFASEWGGWNNAGAVALYLSRQTFSQQWRNPIQPCSSKPCEQRRQCS